MKSRNPVLPLNYHCPDGEPHFINGELYVYPSLDKTPGAWCSQELHVVHSKDLKNWVVDGPAFTSQDVDWDMSICYPAGLMEAKNYKELPKYIKDYLRPFPIMPFKWFKRYVCWIAKKITGKKEDRKLFAPDSITIKDKSYLMFCMSDDTEGVAVSSSPQGPFKNPVKITLDKSKKPIVGIDPGVFQDNDGKTYLYWGQIKSYGGELTQDLTQIKEDTLKYGLLTEEEHGFHEGSSMRKIGNTYYYIFADTHRGKPTALGYATSSSPLGPFEYQGIIVDNDGCDPKTWNNHGSIECVNGQWYVFYHRSTGNSRYLRKMCAEPIFIDENGKIKEVLPSSIGMGDPYKIGEKLYGYEACKVTKKAYIDNDRLIVKKGKSEITYRYVDKNDLDFSSIIYDGTGNAKLTFTIQENGELTIYIDTKQDIEIISFELVK